MRLLYSLAVTEPYAVFSASEAETSLACLGQQTFEASLCDGDGSFMALSCVRTVIPSWAS